ncbi:2-oxoacid dehydrogenases acyltransferase [anaerobic digester metagenome]
MSHPYQLHKIPRSRIATFDVFHTGMQKHHVSALLEFDVTNARKKLRELKRKGNKVSFTAWLIKSIAQTLDAHPHASAFLYSKRALITFSSINVSIVVEKSINGQRVPIPLVITQANNKSIAQIAQEIADAQQVVLTAKDVVINSNTSFLEKLYYSLPQFLRRAFWQFMLNHPKYAYSKMGNVAVTSLSAMGTINGWFIHKSVHPISFGVGSIVKKPLVVDNAIQIREVLNITMLIDHDVIDGAPMARFVKDLAKSIESANELP